MCSGNKELIEALIAEGADVSSNGDRGTPLHRAAEYGNVQAARILIEHGADVNAVGDWQIETSDGWVPETPLDLARNKEMKELLRDHGAVSGKDIPRDEQ